MKPEEIQTEVFFLPCSSSVEKEGSITNSGRWVQWRTAAIPPIDQTKPDAEIVNELYYRVKKLYKEKGGKFPAPIVNLTWDYGQKDKDGKLEKADTHLIAREINGYYLEDVFDKSQTPRSSSARRANFAPPLPTFRPTALPRAETGYIPRATPEGRQGHQYDGPEGEERPTGLGLYSEWSWAWPVNRRILYNRASVDLDGKPVDPKRVVLTWDPDELDKNTQKPGVWKGDVPDGPAPPMVPRRASTPSSCALTAWERSSARGSTTDPFLSTTRRSNARSRRTSSRSSGSTRP